MKITSFWVVTKPIKGSRLIDILWKSNWSEIGLQYLGGLRPPEIYGVWTTKREAEKVAKRLLKEVKN
ncbi:hypothetical protein LCGC14_0603440 [marine sediment metagenome]|uniref:Uncharacterized protein n=1 Tax=marine sediment metagenome TaxID=412755 RepID=A0A0F9RES8_9ZZZZ